MLTVIRNEYGQLQAACEWTPVDSLGNPSNTGKWVWINQVELSTGWKASMVLRQLIDTISEQLPVAEGAYWYRLDKTGKRPHAYFRRQLVKDVVNTSLLNV